MFLTIRMLCLPVLLAILSYALGCPTAERGPLCPPSTVKIVIQTHWNQTSSRQIGVIIPNEEDQTVWKMTLDHTAVVSNDGHGTLESIIILKVTQNNTDEGVAAPSGSDTRKTSANQRYEYYPGVGHYKFHSDVTSWPAARDRCAQEGGHLVIINSQAEREVVRQMFGSRAPSPGATNSDQLHVGLKRDDDGNYTTIFGVPIEETGFSEWSPGQPSSGALEPCMSLMKESMAYNDLPCKNTLASICELQVAEQNMSRNEGVAAPSGSDTRETSANQRYEYYPGVGHYKFHSDVTSWPAARDRCAQEGGHLVIINSQAEREVVRQMFGSRAPSPGATNPDQLHVGLKRDDDGNYTTIFGVPIEETGFSEWSPGQPSSGAREPCMSLMKKSMAYNDLPCKNTLASICELRVADETSIQEQNVIHIGSDKQESMPEPLETEAFPYGYELYPGVGYYKFHHDVTTWPAARERCAREGGHLVIINSQAEREVVRKLFIELNPTSKGSTNSDQIHAGLKHVGEGKYATIFGVSIEETGFSEWFPGQPSSGAREACVSIMKERIVYNDISCSRQILAFICEVEQRAN